MKWNTYCVTAVIAALGAGSAAAQTVSVADFREALTQAVTTNPQVLARWYSFEASREAERVARGGYYPSVDLSADVGREDRETPLVDFDDYSRDATRLSITQMLFDGFATREEVRRLDHVKLGQYYELQAASQSIALQAAQAYLDTVRYQHLARFARDNYVVHLDVYDKIAERTGGGVSQGVDLEQAAARVALAESNLLTEVTNLHDVQARFQRIVGALPAERLSVPAVPSTMIPGMRTAALNLAYQNSPELDAAIENLSAAQAALNATNAPLLPRLDLRYRNEIEHDTDGLEGRYDLQAVELVASYNLFRGGADSARKREFYNRYHAAMEERKQACLNVRQNTMIAFNDIRALQQQVVYLERNLLAQDKTRRAYRDQFDLGQRTLLDLLDSQNEYFNTQRAEISARVDLVGAYARTLANMGLLLAAMDMKGLNADAISELELDLSRDESDIPLCPPEPPPPVAVDKEALFAKLRAGSERYRDTGDERLALELQVNFAHNSSQITRVLDSEITNAAVFLRDHPDVTAIVEGYTDASGSEQYNQWLSERRARRVRQLLIDRYGVSESQVQAAAHGERHPVANNDSEEGRARNRRVELVLDGAAAS